MDCKHGELFKRDLDIQVIGNRLGNKAPDFTVITTEAKAVRLGDFAGQKKPVVVYFMATWCEWCKKDYEVFQKCTRIMKTRLLFYPLVLT